LSGFNIGKYEVAQSQWQTVMGSNPSYFSGCSECPVEQVSWNDIQEFIKKLEKLTGKRFRLPTEAEWEFAARGGNRSRGYVYSGGNNPWTVGWNKDNSNDNTHPVGQKAANELGLYDMSGNVYEWCSDWYGENYYKASPSNNPKGPSSGAKHVLRGGGWYVKAAYSRVSHRNSGYGINSVVGFRLALSQ
jgi:formylglycine-generating enzyme required for sulfatase activity